LYANKLGLLIRGSEISSRVTIFLNVTRIESESPNIVSRVKSSRVIDSSHAITGDWSNDVEAIAILSQLLAKLRPKVLTNETSIKLREAPELRRALVSW